MKLDVIVIQLLIGALLYGCVAPGGEKSELIFDDDPKNAKSGSSDSDLPSGVTRAQSLAAFKDSVFPVVKDNTCFACHGDSNINSPYFAQSNVEGAFDAILEAKKVNFISPESSRLYKRLKDDKHNCWGDCDENAEEMLVAIKKWAEVAKQAVNVSGVTTKSIPFLEGQSRAAQTEYGTLILQAEQETDSVLTGRYKIFGDSKAIGGKYISGGGPTQNPQADAARTSSFRTIAGCEPFTEEDARNDGPSNGPYRIMEQGLHIPSGKYLDDNGDPVKDGYSPYYVTLRYNLVRPDKRLAYAKMLKDNDFTNLDQVILKSGGFDVEDGKPAIAPNLTDNNVTRTGLNILPHFLEPDEVVKDGAYLTGSFTDDQGVERDLHTLFAPQFYDPETDKIFEMLDDKHRKDLFYRSIKNSLKEYFYSNSTPRSIPNLTYFKTVGFDLSKALDLKVSITLEDCNPGDLYCGRNDNKRYEVNSPANAPLTYDNAMDWLKLNPAETAFVSATENETGAFRRIDLYYYPFVDPTDRITRGTLSKTFSRGENGAFKDIETFSTVGSPISVRLDVDGTRSLNLDSYFNGGGEGVSQIDSIDNFSNTLHSVLRSNSCVNCHGDTINQNNINAPKFAQRTAEAAWQILTSRELINFNAPNNSLRRAVDNNAGSIVHNTGNVATVEREILNAISAWKNANDIDLAKNSTKRHKTFTLSERTPGLASYRVKFTEAGDFNIWLRAKSANGANAVTIRVLDSNGNKVSIYQSKKNPQRRTSSCISYDIGDSPSWKWFTLGRTDELENLDSLGNRKLKKGSENDLRPIPDSRFYWRIPSPGYYTVQLMEITDQFKIDLLAIDKVDDFDKDILDFQPDLRSFDEANISNYERNVLKYDVSELAGTPKNTSFFEIEVKEKFDSQNYIFKNPRFISSSSNLKIRNIKALINNEFSFTDTTYTQLDYIVGKDRVLTFAPLITLQYDGKYQDVFAFSFDLVEKSSEELSYINPRGSISAAIEGRKCKDIDLFVKTVKPILMQARLYRKDEYQTYVDDFPGTRRNEVNRPTPYKCISCHTQNHPYFKMTTFENDELLCEQALSRVDFSSYFQSLIIRGINGTYNHPKLHFIEELVFKKENDSSNTDSLQLKPTSNDDFSEFRQFVESQHALNESFHENKRLLPNGTYESQGYVSSWVKNHFDTYKKSDVGITKSSYGSLTEREKKIAKFIGQLKRTSYSTIPNLENRDYYDPFIHDDLSGDIRTEADDIDAGTFNERDYNLYGITNAGAKVDNENNDYNWTGYFDPISTDFSGALRVQKDGNNHIVEANGSKVFNLANGMSTDDDVNDEFERIKQKYRMTVIRWIRSEHERAQAQGN